MSELFLTIDLGNSRCKLRRWKLAPNRAPLLDETRDDADMRKLLVELEPWIQARERLQGAALVSVAAQDVERALAAVLAHALGRRFLAELGPGLAIACREPETVGRDRLFAARAAFELARGSCLVLDAGTALTVDAVRGDAGGRATFLGGAIAPGPALLARALATGTARLPEVTPHPPVRALGRDTREALESGVAVGFAGAASELVRRIAEEAGLQEAPLLLTGGARAFLLEPGLFGERRVVVEPELVHLGLLYAARAGSQ